MHVFLLSFIIGNLTYKYEYLQLSVFCSYRTYSILLQGTTYYSRISVLLLTADTAAVVIQNVILTQFVLLSTNCTPHIYLRVKIS